jgi:hypothetical protein
LNLVGEYRMAYRLAQFSQSVSKMSLGFVVESSGPGFPRCPQQSARGNAWWMAWQLANHFGSR